jgi:hypothetical protein
LLQAEARAEFAEKSVKKLQKEVDRLEGMCFSSRGIQFYLLEHRSSCLDRHTVLLLGWLEINEFFALTDII